MGVRTRRVRLLFIACLSLYIIRHPIRFACYVGQTAFAIMCEVVDLQSLTFHQCVALEGVAHTEFAVFSLDDLKEAFIDVAQHTAAVGLPACHDECIFGKLLRIPKGCKRHRTLIRRVFNKITPPILLNSSKFLKPKKRAKILSVEMRGLTPIGLTYFQMRLSVEGLMCS